MRKFLGFIVGAICGAAVGAVIAIIFTPSSGEELLRDLRGKWEEVMDEARKAQDETRKQLENEYGRIISDDNKTEL